MWRRERRQQRDLCCQPIVHPVARRCGPMKSNGWTKSPLSVSIVETRYFKRWTFINCPRQFPVLSFLAQIQRQITLSNQTMSVILTEEYITLRLTEALE